MKGVGAEVEPENLAAVYPLFASWAHVGLAVAAIVRS